MIGLMKIEWIIFPLLLVTKLLINCFSDMILQTFYFKNLFSKAKRECNFSWNGQNEVEKCSNWR